MGEQNKINSSCYTNVMAWSQSAVLSDQGVVERSTEVAVAVHQVELVLDLVPGSGHQRLGLLG